MRLDEKKRKLLDCIIVVYSSNNEIGIEKLSIIIIFIQNNQ